MKIIKRIHVTILYPLATLFVFFLIHEVTNGFMSVYAPTKDTMYFYGFALFIILLATIILAMISFLFDLLTYKIKERKKKSIGLLFIYIIASISFASCFGLSTYLAIPSFLLLSITYWLIDEWMKSK